MISPCYTPAMKPFHFKQFSIDQDQCAMKVTLDACLLGALCALSVKNEKPSTQAKAILDIGSGTGLLSLMLAQTGLDNITGVELDPLAAEQSKRNIENSPFSKQVEITQTDIQGFSSSHGFDLIITNPPFFSDHLKGPDQRRNQARHNHNLSFSDLASAIESNLNANGIAWLLLPCDEFERFLTQANTFQLAVQDTFWIKTRESKLPHRVVFTLGRSKNQPATEHPTKNTIVIHDGAGSGYSSQFTQLLKDYYLKL
jgi:tRNA1Val (adenine37-N6)-methyltransferase